MEPASTGGIARVVLLPAVGGLGELDYRVPLRLWRENLIGCRVLVPLGRRRAVGVACGLTATSSRERLKEVEAVIDEIPVLDRPLLDLCRWMADYYLVPLAETVSTALPGTLRFVTERWVSLTPSLPVDAPLSGHQRELMEALRAGRKQVAALARSGSGNLMRTIRSLQRKGWVEVTDTLRESTPTKHLQFYEALCPGQDSPEVKLARRPSTAALYQYLADHPLGRAALPELRSSFPNAAAKLRTLVATGLVRCVKEEVYRPVTPMPGPDRSVTPTTDQGRALETIAASKGFSPFLLWGVTGSGKTEVYLRAIASVLEEGRTVLVLVPEISLTHQLVDRLQARFGRRVAVLHSALSVGERWDEWRRVARGEASIVTGARSAIFAPLPSLGLIVVDEEHDPSYKQEEGIRYHGRDVAVMRARLAGCAVVLGSATPSMESYHNARTGRYQLLQLRQRVESRPLPEVEIIDLRRGETRTSTGRSGAVRLAPTLMGSLKGNFAAGGQSLVFLNRRGFANFVQCYVCGEAIACPNCCVALTYHRAWHALRCHHCDHTIPHPQQCPTCGENGLTGWGIGTEHVEAMLAELLPGARVARMDRDTMTRKGAQRLMLSKWEAGQLDVLIGTQMITKGHDIPGVTLVAVLLADLSLNFPDFRAGERTFQLLTQVAGRAGRGDRAGRVIVQTLQPEHCSLRLAAGHDFARFAEEELGNRRELGYPPFTRLVLVRVEGEQLAAVQRLARKFAEQLRANGGRRLVVLGPAPAPIERLRGRHRWQVLCRTASGNFMRRCVATTRDQLRAAARAAAVRVIVDVDPQSML